MKFNIKSEWWVLYSCFGFKDGWMSLKVAKFDTDLICLHGHGCSSSTLGS